MDLLIPKPVSIKRGEGAFAVPTTITVAIAPDMPEVRGVADELAALLQSTAGGNVTIHNSEDGAGQITLRLLHPGTDNRSQLGGEGYYLRIPSDGILLEAVQPAGLFHAVQTLRQLLPPPGKGHIGVTLPPARSSTILASPGAGPCSTWRAHFLPWKTSSATLTCWRSTR